MNCSSGFADGQHAVGLAARQREHEPVQVGVVAACQTAVAADDDKQVFFTGRTSE